MELHYEVFKGGVNFRLGNATRDRWSRYKTHVSVICFTSDGRVVGSLQCYREGRGKFRTHHAAGTFVDGDFQRHGIATTMWRLALEQTAPKIVSVQVVSDRGKTLALALAEKFPEYKWDVWGGQGLRRLRKKRGKHGSGRASNRMYYHPGW